jgi:hemolysin III
VATDTSISDPHPYQSDFYERLNAATHGIGFLLSLAGTVVIVAAARASGTAVFVAAAAYGATLMAVYALSTLSHAVQEEQAKDRLRAWDQGAIYFLIVGTYTPFVAAYLPPERASWLAAAIWIAACLGFVSKVIAGHRVNALATWSYLLLGWLPAFAFIGRVPLIVFAYMAAGGLSYTLGLIFLKLDHRYWFFHSVWHLLVILASAIHFYAIYTLAIPS